VPDFPAQRIEPLGTVSVANDSSIDRLELCPNALGIPEPTARFGLGFVARHAGCHELLDASLEVKAQLLIDVFAHVPRCWRDVHCAANVRPGLIIPTAHGHRSDVTTVRTASVQHIRQGRSVVSWVRSPPARPYNCFSAFGMHVMSVLRLA
jgi:hypothetical protein